jgi:hypothetical protein
MVLGQTLFVLQVPMDIRELMVLILNLFIIETVLLKHQMLQLPHIHLTVKYFLKMIGMERILMELNGLIVLLE